MSAAIFTKPVSALYRHLGQIAANIAYIRHELPDLEMPGTLRAALTQMCSDFDSVLYDLRKEVRSLEDKLGMHPDEKPFDPDVVNQDPKVTLALIESWLRHELDALHAVVKELERAAERGSDMTIILVLVAESGANILNAFAAIQDELKFISAKVDEARDAH